MMYSIKEPQPKTFVHPTRGRLIATVCRRVEMPGVQPSRNLPDLRGELLQRRAAATDSVDVYTDIFEDGSKHHRTYGDHGLWPADMEPELPLPDTERRS